MREQYKFFLFLLILFSLFVDIYAFQSIKRLVTNFKIKPVIYVIYGCSSFFFYGIILYGLFSDYAYPFWTPQHRAFFMMTLCCLFVFKFVLAGFTLLDDIKVGLEYLYGFFFISKKSFSQEGNKMGRGKFISTIGVFTAAIPFAGLIAGVFVGAYRYTIHRHKIRLSRLPNVFQDLTIVHISDIHAGSFTDKNQVRKGVDMINNLQPDLIFFTGDLVNYRSDEMDDYMDVFDKLNAKYGIFSVMGNHDYGDYMEWETPNDKQVNLNKMIDIHRDLGWKLLRNEHHILEINNQKIAIVGVENWGKGRFAKYGKLKEALIGLDRKIPVKLLLSHDPSHWDAQVRPQYKDIDVTFSGHTHGAQLGIEHKALRWSPAQYLYKQWAGLYKKNNQYLYVNRGYGFIGYPGRIGIMPEITHIELTNKA